MAANNECQICYKTASSKELNHYHKNSVQHRLNFSLFELHNYWKSVVKDRHGVTVKIETITDLTCEYNKNLGRYSVHLSGSDLTQRGKSIDFKVTIKNTVKSHNILLREANLIESDRYKTGWVYSIQKHKHMVGNNRADLKPGASISFIVNFKMSNVVDSRFDTAIQFQFETVTTKTNQFNMYRQLLIVIKDDIDDTDEKFDSPFKGQIWEHVYLTPSVSLRTVLEQYVIPEYKTFAFAYALQKRQWMNWDQIKIINEMKQVVGSGLCPKEKYADFFHILLWLDEAAAAAMIQKYNMSKVVMCAEREAIKLNVPGLGEKRPSLIVGDIIRVKLADVNAAHEGCISRIENEHIVITSLDREIVQLVIARPQTLFDVSFVLNRLQYERMHEAVDRCVRKGFLSALFPEAKCQTTPLQPGIPDKEFINKNILQNSKQREAVTNILNKVSLPHPYVVFGPPGTGKTDTIVEAILQIKRRHKGAHILVCAPSNDACDMLTIKLIPHCTKNELIRICAENKQWTSRQLYSPDYLFIDEAAQAKEPETDIAISLLTLKSQIVLSGDPKQLGPMCCSKKAEELGLGMSFLERLMTTNSLYMTMHPSFVTMLIYNYRSHPTVLKIINHLFYENQLQVKSDAANDLLARIFIYRRMFGLPQILSSDPAVEFCSILSEEERKGQSPSYFNKLEVDMVGRYVKCLLDLRDVTVTESEIGVITPYKRQLSKIKEKLRYLGYPDVEVGTTEVFQGREKRVILISTVRAKASLRLYDRKYQLGFLVNVKRTNVAVSRAKAKLIIIGSPHVLCYDDNWKRIINYCRVNSSMCGADYYERTTNVQEDMIGRLQNMKLIDDQYPNQQPQ